MEERLSISATSASCSRDKWSQYFPRVPAPVEAGDVDGVTDDVKGESKLLVLLGEEKGSGSLRPG